MRRARYNRGFLYSWFINMMFRPEWAILAIILFMLNRKFGLSKWFAIAALAIWFIYPLILTAFLGWVRRVGSIPDPHKENKNPYSSSKNPYSSGAKTMNANINTACPVCGKFNFDEIGKYEICSVCGWEDDPVQRRDPDFAGGANEMSLNRAREAYNSRKDGE